MLITSIRPQQQQYALQYALQAPPYHGAGDDAHESSQGNDVSTPAGRIKGRQGSNKIFMACQTCPTLQCDAAFAFMLCNTNCSTHCNTLLHQHECQQFAMAVAPADSFSEQQVKHASWAEKAAGDAGMDNWLLLVAPKQSS
jgi:hypothetical protein